MKIYLHFKSFNPRLLKIIQMFHLKHDQNSRIGLLINSNSLELYDRKKKNQSSIKIDFTSKKNNYRLYNKNIKNEILYKVTGIKKNYFPTVVDGTAGLGQDAWILYYLGCTVTMIERNPVIAALLQDGLERAYENKRTDLWITNRLRLIHNNSFTMFDLPITKPDVIYLDPMYPDKKKNLYLKKKCKFCENL